MAILFMILKVILIALLSIFAILLIVLTVVMFAAIRYDIKAEKGREADSNVNAKGLGRFNRTV